MKIILTKTNKAILSIFFALIVMVGVFTVMPDKSLKATLYLFLFMDHCYQDIKRLLQSYCKAFYHCKYNKHIQNRCC